MKPSSFSFIIASVFCLFISCHHEPFAGGSQYLTAGIAGRVVDEWDLPLSNVQVEVEGSNGNTDVNGYFKISNLQLKKEGVVVKLIKAGYFTGIRSFIPTQNSTNNIEVKLIKKNAVGNINVSAGGIVNIPSGGSISFPSNSLVNATTNVAYSGTATISAFFINPTASDFQKILPGDLRGIDVNNQQVGLRSFGMMTVEINGASGEKLQLASGTQAIITFPIPTSLNQQSQATIPLWFLDETTGLWKQEGSANKQGNSYVGSVAHFSCWNCDYPFPLIQFTATIHGQQNQPLVGMEIWVKASNGSSGHGITDGDGKIAGSIPMSQQLKMYIYGSCTDDSLDIGPFATNHDFGVIQTHASDGNVATTITGHVLNCSGNAVTDGYVNVSLDGAIYRVNTNNGNFSIGMQHCDAVSSAQLVAYDITSNKQSNPLNLTLSTGNLNLGNLTACTSLDEYIYFSVDGSSQLMVPPFDSLAAEVWQGMQTQIFSFNMDSTIGHYFDLGFLGNTPGTYTIDLLKIDVGDHSYVKPDGASMNVVITEFGNLYQFIGGNFSGYIRDTINHTTVPVNCNFRVKRD
jgi:hypothetical protein